MVVAYADYVVRQHAYALSYLVDGFTNDQSVGNNVTDDTASTQGTNKGFSDSTTDINTEEEGGFGSTIAGLGVVICVTIAAAYVPMMKSTERSHISRLI